MFLKLIIPFLAGFLVGVVLTTIYLLQDIIREKDLTKDEVKKINEIIGEDLIK